MDLLTVLIVATILAATPGAAPRVSAQDATAETAQAEPTEVDEPVVETPVEEIAPEVPVDETVVEDPWVADPVIDEPSVEAPVGEEPTVDEPTEGAFPTEGPTATATAEPTAAEPASDEATLAAETPVTATDVATVEPTPEPTPSPKPRLRRSAGGAAEIGAAAGSTLPITLTLSPSGTQPAETSVAAQAAWSSIPGGMPTGTITYRVFNGTGCTGTLFSEAGTKTIVGTPTPNGSVPASDAVAMTTAGSFSWQASYSGDVSYNASSVCASQTIAKRTPTVVLALSPSGGVAGDAFTGVATISSATSTAAGTISYALYTTSSCSTTQAVTGTPSVKTVTGGVAPASDPITINLLTSYWKAVYAGDTNNTTASSNCVILTLGKRSPTISTVATSTSGVAGQPAFAQATLANITSNAVGTVTYGIYTDSACTAVLPLIGNTHAKTVAGGVVPVGNTLTIPTVTTYWKASYGGDTYNNAAVSACVVVTLAKASPTLSLVVTPTLIPMKAAGTAKGQGTLSSAGATAATTSAAGTGVYTVYKDSACSVVLVAASSKTVASRAVPVSSTTTINQAGFVYWQVVYSGDANNNGATSPCVEQAVAKSDPTSTLTITPSTTPMKAGSTAKARGTFGSTTTTSTVTGTITYGVYTDSACTTFYPVAGNPHNKVVTNRSTGTSNSFTFANVGTYYWRMDFLGDANNNPATGPCTAMVVTKSTPTLTLTITPSSTPMRAGGTAYAKTTMTLSNTTAAGSATYTVYSDSVCTATLAVTGSPSTVTVTNKVVPNSALASFPTVGTIYWKIAYAGDANNSAATSGCVALVVGSSTPTLTLTTSPSGSMTVGNAATASATLTGSTATAGGSATYTVYTDSGCTTQLSAGGNPSAVTVVNKVIPSSAPITLSAVGTVYWRVAYGGDVDNGAATSSCLALVVTKRSPTMSLVVTHPVSPMQAGGTAAGQATLAGATTTASGSVVYTVFSNNICTVAAVPSKTSTEVVASGAVGISDDFTFNTLGTFYWLAQYGGDGQNNAAVSACVALAVVDAAAAVIEVVVVPNPIAAGASAGGYATLSGVTGTAGGTVVYAVYANGACTTQVSPAKTSTKTVVNGVAPASDVFPFATVGTFYWTAVYSGDGSNAGDTSACVALTVNKAAPSVALAVSPSPVLAGSGAVGTATLTGATAAAAGAATFTVYSNNVCTTPVSPAKTSGVTVTAAVVPASAALTIQTAGTVYWRVVYAGDANNQAATSPCVSVVVSKAAPTLALSVSPGTITVWGTATGSAAITGGTTSVTGSVVYTVYADTGCNAALSPAKTSTKPISGGVVASVAFMFDLTEVVYWQATYGGDANNDLAESPCVPLTVDGGSLTASVSSVTMTPVGFSSADQTNTGTMTLTLVDQRGTLEGWSVTLSASDFAYTGVASGAIDIPAGAFSIQSAGNPIYVRGQAINGANGPAVPSGGAVGPLDEPVVVLVANDGYGGGEYTQSYTVVLVIPGGSRAGTYTAVVDTITSAAP